jgi:hypothetical protein
MCHEIVCVSEAAVYSRDLQSRRHGTADSGGSAGERRANPMLDVLLALFCRRSPAHPCTLHKQERKNNLPTWQPLP